MDRHTYYSIYQENLNLLDIEIKQVKRIAQEAIGHKNWLERNGGNPQAMAVLEKEIEATTRLMTFLICSWFEARLMKLLYEESAVAFLDQEISQIRSMKEMSKKWKTAYLVSVGKATGISYTGSEDYSIYYPQGSVAYNNYLDVLDMFSDIEDAITIRNRLAHGQWKTQFNSNNTNTCTYPFIVLYDNVQKLDILMQIFKTIAEIINKYVVYKDKNNPNFDLQVQQLVNIVKDKKKRISSVDFSKYADKLGNTYANRLRRLSND